MAGGTYTQAQLETLTAAIARGVVRVEYSGTNGTNLVIYDSLDAMRKLRSEMIAELGSVGDSPRQPNAFRSQFESR